MSLDSTNDPADEEDKNEEDRPGEEENDERSDFLNNLIDVVNEVNSGSHVGLSEAASLNVLSEASVVSENAVIVSNDEVVDGLSNKESSHEEGEHVDNGVDDGLSEESDSLKADVADREEESENGKSEGDGGKDGDDSLPGGEFSLEVVEFFRSQSAAAWGSVSEEVVSLGVEVNEGSGGDF